MCFEVVPHGFFEWKEVFTPPLFKSEGTQILPRAQNDPLLVKPQLVHPLLVCLSSYRLKQYRFNNSFVCKKSFTGDKMTLHVTNIQSVGLCAQKQTCSKRWWKMGWRIKGCPLVDRCVYQAVSCAQIYRTNCSIWKICKDSVFPLVELVWMSHLMTLKQS